MANGPPEPLSHCRVSGSGAGNFWRRASVNPERKLVQVVPRGPYAMGRVSIGAQWTAVAFGFLLSPLFVVFMVWFVGWLVYCRLWPRRGVVPRAVLGDHLRRAETVGWVSGTQASTTSAKQSRNYRND
jgi:hypothetical protein